jgi:hypothetical protein
MKTISKICYKILALRHGEDVDVEVIPPTPLKIPQQLKKWKI